MSLLDNFVNCRMCIKGSQKSMLKFAARVLHNEWGTIVFGWGQFKAIFLHYQHCISLGDCLVICPLSRYRSCVGCPSMESHWRRTWPVFSYHSETSIFANLLSIRSEMLLHFRWIFNAESGGLIAHFKR